MDKVRKYIQKQSKWRVLAMLVPTSPYRFQKPVEAEVFRTLKSARQSFANNRRSPKIEKSYLKALGLTFGSDVRCNMYYRLRYYRPGNPVGERLKDPIAYRCI